MKKILFTFCLIYSVLVSAQKNLKPGYIIELNGDTVFCEIDYRDWELNPDKITIRLKGAEVSKDTSNINGFGILGRAAFEKRLVTVHLNPISGNQLPKKYSEEVQRRQAFLYIIEQGEYNLYELDLKDRFYFYLAPPNGEIQELIYRVKQTDSQIFEDQQFKSTLMQYLAEKGLATAYQNKIEQINYTNTDLVKIVKLLNNSQQKIKSKIGPPTGKIKVGLFMGGVLNQYSSFNGYNDNINHLNSNLSVNGGANFTYSFPRVHNRIKIGLAIGAIQISNQTKVIDSFSRQIEVNYFLQSYAELDYSFKLTMMSFNLYSIYEFNPLSKFKLYAKGGVQLNGQIAGDKSITCIYKTSKTWYRNGNLDFTTSANGKESQFLPIREFWPHLNIGLGISYQRFNLELNYCTPANISSIYSKELKYSTLNANICFLIF